jgi:hypothetical protein
VNRIERMERIEADIQEPILEGDSLTYRDARVHKYAWMCIDCRAVWSMKWHAESCASRNHAMSFEQSYQSSFLDAYGKLMPPTVFVRTPIRVEPRATSLREYASDAPASSPKPERDWDVKVGNYIFHIVRDPEAKSSSLLRAARTPTAQVKWARMREQTVRLFRVDADDITTHVCVTHAQAIALGLPKP